MCFASSTDNLLIIEIYVIITNFKIVTQTSHP